MGEIKVMDPTQNGVEGPAKPLTVDENNEKAMAIEKAMEEKSQALTKKKYRVKTTIDTVNYLMEDFYSNVAWNGYECYAISETHKTLEKTVSKIKPSKTGKVSFTMTPDLLQALFHFIKGHANTGLELARKHRVLCEDFSVPMSELNTDHQGLRDMAVEAEAAKHGITVDDYKKAAAQQQAAQGRPGMPVQGPR